ncbi:Ig-like domain-containing protein [Brevibacillus agri]|uniref:Ig-like domain-containing protein n=1 Tax=Brevibacillus agri TaxID=51101 RepID=UPI001C8D5365|nr:Ig-like domain-containing protein [Brevibacillus agri]MBY0054439.1 Ig-like domain-containing protein [Brevibacillus agri]
MNKKVTLSLLSATVFASMAASAFAAPTQGVYMGGSVDKFYKLDDLFNLSAAAKKQFVVDMNAANPDLDFKNLVFVDFDGKGAKFSEILAAGTLPKAKRDLTKADFEGSYVTVNLDGSNGASYDPRNDAVDVPTGDLKVESVSAINAASLTIKFTKEMDATSATNPANYKIDGDALNTAAWGTLTSSDLKLSDDKKSVTINFKFTNTLTSGTNYRIQVSKNVKDKAGNPIPEYDQFYKFEDKTAPTVTSAEYIHKNTTFVINFSEPLAGGASGAASKVKIYDETNSDVTSLATITLDSTTQSKITIDVSNTSLPSGKNYRVVMQGATDLSGNYFAGNKVEYTFKKDAADTTKPTVTDLTAQSDKVVRVTFSEPVFVDASASGKIAEISLDGEDLSGTTGGPTTTNVVQATNLSTAGNAVMVNNDPKVWDIALVGSAGTGLTGVHAVTISKVFDLQGNEIETPFSKLLQFNADKTAPTVVSSSTAGTKLFLTLDEEVTLAATANLTVVTPDGVEKTVSVTPAYDNGNKKVAVFDLGASVVSKAGTYQVTIPANAITDASNNTKSYSLTANFSPADSVKPTLFLDGSGNIDASAVVQDPSDNNVIRIKFSEPVGSSALDVNNYTIDGQKVFKRAVYDGTDATKSTIKLTLNDNALATSGDKLVGVSGVADLAGNVIEPVTTLETINENTAPRIVSAKLVANNQIKLTFSEPVTAAGTGTITDADFTVYVGGTVANLSSATLAANGAGVSEVTLTLANPITDLSKVIEVEASSTNDVVDADKVAASGVTAVGNALATGKVTVTP